MERIILFQHPSKQILYHHIMACVLQIPQIILEYAINQKKEQNKRSYPFQIPQSDIRICQRDTMHHLNLFLILLSNSLPPNTVRYYSLGWINFFFRYINTCHFILMIDSGWKSMIKNQEKKIINDRSFFQSGFIRNIALIQSLYPLYENLHVICFT